MSLETRHFLFLQAPHGPFFAQLGKALRTAGHVVSRVGFNAGDQFFWGRNPGYVAFQDEHDRWPAFFATLCTEKNITDLVLYGDVRAVHAQALAIAKVRGLRCHVFEEGYLRPYWVTYERNGSNGNSALMTLDFARIQGTKAMTDQDTGPPPAHWGDMREHVFYGALYHWWVMFRNGGYPHFRPHRALPVRAEAALYFRRMLLMPWLAIERHFANRRILNSAFPFHVVLMQLEHDSSFQAHSDFQTMTCFFDLVLRGFAEGAPQHHHLVFKAHPLENGRTANKSAIFALAKKLGCQDRVHFLSGGKLARLLDQATSAVTINSTAGQQVLWRGLPLKIFGRAVYDKPTFVSDQTLSAFFAAPTYPDAEGYRAYRRFLLATSQIPGGFYAARGRKQVLRQIVDKMIAAESPYDTFLK